MSVKHHLQNRWLLLSLAINLLLLAACLLLLLFARHYYSEYRFFRQQAHGSSEASTIEAVSDTQQKVLVLYGDSRISQWQPLPSPANTVVLNAGVAGESTSEIRRRLQQDVLRHSPDVVLIQAGMNDLATAATRGIRQPEQHITNLKTNIEYLLQTLSDQGVQVILTPILPNKPLNPLRRLFWHNELHNLLADNNRHLQQLAAAHKAGWLDLTPVLYNSQGKLRVELFIDTLHFKQSVYNSFNDAVIKLLENPGN